MNIKKLLSYILLVLLVLVSQPTSVNASVDRESLRTDGQERIHTSQRPVRPEREISEYRTDEILVKMKGSDRPIRVHNKRGLEIDDLVQEYTQRADVEYAEPNYIAYASYIPNDTHYPLQWNFDNAEYGGVQAAEAWDTENGKDIVVAIIDTGVAYENYGSRWRGYAQAPDLAGTTFVQGYDFVNNDYHANDDQGHGTHVAGTIAQTTNNDLGVAGLAHGASIMPLKALSQSGSGSYADLADAIRYAADNGAHVINMSLGGSQSSTSLADAVTYAHDKGVTIVAASGNDGKNMDSYPASYPEVISVGATRYDETRAPYSNYGSSLDIVAPGGDTSVDQNGDGYGDGILQQTFGSSRSSFGYYFYQGTSMATPHVAAAAAMIISAGIASTPDDVRIVLQTSADDLGTSGRDDIFGHGLLNVAAALGVGVVQPPQPEPEPEPEPGDEIPTIVITNPINAATVNELITFSADADDTEGVDTVDFLIDGVLHTQDDSAPYETSWDTTMVQNGSHTLTAIVYDSIGQTATDTLSVVVSNQEVTPSEIEVFTESFENGFTQWSQDSQRDWRTSRQRATDGRSSAEIDGGTTNGTLTSVDIDLQGKTNVSVAFSWYIESRLDTDEYIAFDVSTDGGTTWINADSLEGNMDTEDVWHHEEYQLANITALQIRYRGDMNRSNEDADVDNIVVTAF